MQNKKIIYFSFLFTNCHITLLITISTYSFIRNRANKKHLFPFYDASKKIYIENIF